MIEETVLYHLLHSPDFWKKVFPYIKPEYFHDRSERTTFELIREYADKYGKSPTTEALTIELDRKCPDDENLFQQTSSIIEKLKPDSEKEKPDLSWLVEKTEEFCQDRAIHNAIRSSINILDGKDTKIGRGSIPQLLNEALGVSFDGTIGHDFLDEWMSRFEQYHNIETKIPFNVAYLNKITNGGIYRKTLTVLLAGTGVGKSLAMCSFAADNLSKGLNVLYITNELSEIRVAERIDANLLDCTIDELKEMPRQTYEARIEKLKAKTKGKLIIKEYPTSSAGAANFRHLLNELRIKKNFVPDVIYIDYLNICISSRVKMGASINSYTYIKAIAEELRGLAVEFNVPVITATQLNREGFTNSDPGLENTSESFGLPATADLMFAMITNEEMAKLGQLLFKQLKNRYRDENLDRRFIVGVDRPKMRLYDADQSAQKGVIRQAPETSQAGKKKFDPSVFDGVS